MPDYPARVPSREAQLVTSIFPPPGVDLVELFRDPGTWARWEPEFRALVDDDAEVVIDQRGHPTTYGKGADALRVAWLDWLAPWESYSAPVAEVRDAPNGQVVSMSRNRGRLRGSDGDVQMDAAAVYTFRDGLIVKLEFYADRAEALAAAGLPSDSE